MSKKKKSPAKKSTVNLAIIAFLTIVAVAFAYMKLSSFEDDNTAGLKIPKLSEAALTGQKLFNKNCAKCHGENGVGTDQGPPLIHNIYNPGHHGDSSFYRAVAEGSMQHHWSFGDMPPQTHVEVGEVTKIIAFIREVQSANGIKSKKHTM